MLGRLDKTFSNNRVAFDKVKLSQLTDYNLGVGEFHLHYHGDGIVKKRRDIVVLKDGENSGNKPAIHSSVFNLMDSKKLILSTTFDGFAKIEAIRYMPKSITGLMGNFALIE
jgi:signal peptidase I